MRPPRTVAMCERDLRAAMNRPGTKLHISELNGDTLAWVEYEGKRYEVMLDPFRGGLIECTLHELLHAVYRVKLGEWGVFEEDFVLALERRVVERVNTDPKRVKWWRSAISAKLDKEDD